MQTYSTHCCAIMELGDLSKHLKAEDAMVAFCRGNLAAQVRYKTYTPFPNTLYSFYLFTAACQGTQGGEQYGTRFKAFIEKHGLGTVWESPAIVNKSFHPDHANQVYVWIPDESALRLWWTKYLEAEKAQKLAAAKAKKALDADILKARTMSQPDVVVPKSRQRTTNPFSDPYKSISWTAFPSHVIEEP